MCGLGLSTHSHAGVSEIFALHVGLEWHRRDFTELTQPDTSLRGQRKTRVDLTLRKHSSQFRSDQTVRPGPARLVSFRSRATLRST